jgi:hypothetical protein
MTLLKQVIQDNWTGRQFIKIATVDKNYLTRFNVDNKLNCNKIYDCGNLIFGLQ